VYEFNTVFGQINFVHTLLRAYTFLLDSFSEVQKAARSVPAVDRAPEKSRMQVKTVAAALED